MNAPKPTIETQGDSLVINVPLAYIKAVAEADDFNPVHVTDRVAFAQYLARYLHACKGEDDVLGILEGAILHVRDAAIYAGAGIRSQLDDIPSLIDRMWRSHEEVLMTNEGYPAGLTTHGCLVEAMNAARAGKLDAAAKWLDVGQDFNETVAEVLEKHVEEAMRYALATYGSQSNGSTPPVT